MQINYDLLLCRHSDDGLMKVMMIDIDDDNDDEDA